MMKKCVVSILTYFGIFKYDYKIKTRETLNFLLLIKSSFPFSSVTSANLIIIFNCHFYVFTFYIFYNLDFYVLHFYQLCFSLSLCHIDLRWLHHTYVISCYWLHLMQSYYQCYLSCYLALKAYFFYENIVCFTPKSLARFQNCFILLQAVCVVFEFNFMFYYTLLCVFCHLVNIAIIYQINIHLWSQTDKPFRYSST